MMSLLWYYRPEHLQGGRSPSMHEVSHWADRMGKAGVAEGEVVAQEGGMGRADMGSLVPRLVTLDTREPGGRVRVSVFLLSAAPIHVSKGVVTFI